MEADADAAGTGSGRRSSGCGRNDGRRRLDGSGRAGCRGPGLREHTGDHEFELQSRRRRAGHLVERRDDEIGGARQPERPVDVGLAHHAREFFGRHPPQHVGRTLARRRDHDEVAQAFEQVVDEAARVLTGLHHPVDRGEGGGGIARAERVDDLVEQFGVRVAEQRHGPGVRHDGAFGAGDQLIEERQGVSR